MITIRRLDANDFQLWRNIRLEALQKHPEYYLSAYEEEHLKTDKDWQESLQNNDVFGLFDNSKLISVLCYTQFKNVKSQHKAQLWGIYTLPSYRKQGYARKILVYVLKYAKKRVKKCVLSCSNANQGAINIYKQLGFISFGLETKSIIVNGKYYDENLMVLDFE
jgi:ribosomal protein S18 acetylase RimI-like enzyme